MDRPGGVDDHEPVALELRVDGREQRGKFAGVDESIAKTAERALVERRVGQANAAEVYEVDAHVERIFEFGI